jgi:tetratricopeptide (TPR) repeat protein
VKPRSKTRRRLKIAVTVLAIILFMREIGISSAAARIAGTAPTTELDEIGTLWNQYDSLARRSVLGFGTGDLASALTTQTEALADRVFANYRAPQPTVREAQWRQVRTGLARALSTRPRNTHLRAMVRYTDGHLHRIDGEARKTRRLLAEAQREFADAVAAFREAAELRPEWPDPYLGLARTFIYGLDDVDRAADAFQRAERAGYTPGSREAAQLGDGYRSRADSLARSARDVAGLAQERDYLTRAVEQYRYALEHYTKATDFAGVPRNIALAQRSLTTLERRLTALSTPPFDPQAGEPWR